MDKDRNRRIFFKHRKGGEVKMFTKVTSVAGNVEAIRLNKNLDDTLYCHALRVPSGAVCMW